MTHINRPTQIATILETIGSGEDHEISAELETYIADLEAKQPDRPSRIATILQTVSSQYPVDMGSALEAYIADLEASQQPIPSGKAPRDSASLYWHGVKREQQRRARSLRKQNNYQ